MLADHLLFRLSGQPARRVTGFGQLGIAEQSIDRFGSHLGVGLAIAGIVPERPDDQAGIAAAISRSGSGYVAPLQQSAVPVAGTETVIEISYLTQIVPWPAIQADAYYPSQFRPTRIERDGRPASLRANIPTAAVPAPERARTVGVWFDLNSY